MIKPTVGRVVLYQKEFVEPCAAIVTRVWSDMMVNLAVFAPDGTLHARLSVYLRQPDTPEPDGAYCEWMPYQKGQAAKTEALEAKLAETVPGQPPISGAVPDMRG